MRKSAALLLFGVLAALGDYLPTSQVLAGQAGPAGPPSPAPVDKIILSSEALWRTRLVFEPEEVLLNSGQVDHVRLKLKGDWKQAKTIEQFEVEKVPFFRLPAHTPQDWMMPDFDDGDWARANGPMLLDDEKRVQWKLLLLRGTFQVTDPARAAGLKLSIDYKGGIVVWLNGQELTRQHMPQGPLDTYACADPDPKEAFLFPDGYLGAREGWQKPFAEWTNILGARIRRLRDFDIRPADLRRRRNVLAVAIHRPPARWEFYATRTKAWPIGAYDDRSGALWSRVALHNIELAAPASAAVEPNLGRHKTEGLAVWNHPVVRRVFTSDYDDPFAPLRLVKIAALPNGVFTGQVVVSADKPIKGWPGRSAT